ncbi:MAG: PH domain-containing protein [Bdellovibrionales bacterium]|nr:PH domain-containing protein [Bdellovibrionales bacterium]
MSNNEFDDIRFDDQEEAFDLDAEHAPPVREIYGTPSNIQENGSPVARSGEQPIRYYFYPTWRSQLLNLCAFVVLCVLAVVVSWYVPVLVVAGSLFSLGDTTYYLHLPILVLLPGAMLGKILIHIYDAKFIIDERGVEAQIGLVSLNLRQPRLRWEDIRGVEPNQTIWERLLGIGSVLIGSAMTQDVEIVMSGVANPRAVQLLINSERDRRLRELSANNHVHVRQAMLSD